MIRILAALLLLCLVPASAQTPGNFAPGESSGLSAHMNAEFATKADVAASAATVTATGSTTARTLAVRAADTVNIEDYKLAGDPDYTLAFARAFAVGNFVQVLPGHTYLVKNITLPSFPFIADLVPGGGIICFGGIATIRAVAGGDTDYLIANRHWVLNLAFADLPAYLANVTLDGAGIVRDVFPILMYGAIFDHVVAENGTRYGYWFSNQTHNGTVIANSLENIHWLESPAINNGSDGLHSDTIPVTDGQILGGHWFGNGGYQISLSQSAGWQINGIHAYGASGKSLFMQLYGFSTSVANNVFEGTVVIDSLAAASKGAVFGPSNSLLMRVQVNFADGTAGEVFRSLGNVYQSTADLRNNYNAPGHMVIADSDHFLSNAPFSWIGDASSVANIIARGSYSPGTGNYTGMALLDGLQIPAGAGGNSTPNEWELVKTLNTAGTTTTFTIAATISNFNGGGLSIRGQLDVWMVDLAGTGVESYTSDIQLLWTHLISTTTEAKAAVINNALDTGAGISAAAVITGTPISGNSTLSIVITITHPQPSATVDANKAKIRLRSINRNVAFMSLF